ncbi:MAG: hypothetical protein WAK56_07870 [Candidatus Sulfotelmatobacter sp.]
MRFGVPGSSNPNRSQAAKGAFVIACNHQEQHKECNITWCWLRWVTTIYYVLAIVLVLVPT